MTTSAAKRKGYSYERKLLGRLRSVWPNINRSAPYTESNDFTGPFPIEAKKRSMWEVRDWVRRILKVTPNREEWIICISDSDKRNPESLPDVMVLPFEMGMDLLHHHYGPFGFLAKERWRDTT